jgi:hypothetical protein
MMPKSVLSVLLIAVVHFVLGERALGQAELKEQYRDTFNGPASKYPGWGLHGAQAANNVKFEPEGLRIQLPAGFEGQRPAAGVATRVTVKGDFQITTGYEILQEPSVEEVGTGQTRLTMDVVLAQPHNDAATLSRRVVPRAGKQVYPWMWVWEPNAGKSMQRKTSSVPAKAATGRLRIERTGKDLVYLLADGDGKDFARVGAGPFSTDDVVEVRLVATTGGTKAGLDVRFHDIEIRAESMAKPPTAPTPTEIKPPQKDYAQEYTQPFKGVALPAGWIFEGPFADNCVHFEPAGMRINLPLGWGDERQATGIKSGFGIKGDFEITLSFEILAEPAPRDAGRNGTRLSLGVWKETDRSNLATINRGIGPKEGTNFVSWQSLWDEDKGTPARSLGVFLTPAKSGRFRLIRSGSHLYFGFAEGLDGAFRFRAKYNFGPEDVRDIRITAATGSEQATIDVRATDLHIRADAIPNAPGVAPLVAAGNIDAPVIAVAPSRAWLVATLLIGAVVLLVMAVALVGAIVLFRGRKMPAPAGKEVVKKRK